MHRGVIVKILGVQRGVGNGRLNVGERMNDVVESKQRAINKEHHIGMRQKVK